MLCFDAAKSKVIYRFGIISSAIEDCSAPLALFLLRGGSRQAREGPGREALEL